jgi:hypothetical protein
MRPTLNYRSTLVMAATLGGSALAQAGPPRVSPEHYWTGAGEPVHRRSVAAPYQPQRTGPMLRDGAKLRAE